MANLYWATSFTGGIPGSLDAISVTDAVGNGSGILLTAGDSCFVVTSANGAELYILQNSAGATEDGRNVIIPDNNTGNLWWKRVQMGVPSGVCVAYLGTVVPDGWVSVAPTFTSGGLIKKV